MLETIDEMGEELCNYCWQTNRGKCRSYSTPNGYNSCEGSYCEDAYEVYLERYCKEHNVDITDNVIKYMTKVKCLNKEEFE